MYSIPNNCCASTAKSFLQVVANLVNLGDSVNLVQTLTMLPTFVAIILAPVAVLGLIHT